MNYELLTKKQLVQKLKLIQQSKENKLIRTIDSLNQFLWSLGYREIHSELNKIMQQICSQEGLKSEDLEKILCL